jgi:hypothetical protein
MATRHKRSLCPRQEVLISPARSHQQLQKYHQRKQIRPTLWCPHRWSGRHRRRPGHRLEEKRRTATFTMRRQTSWMTISRNRRKRAERWIMRLVGGPRRCRRLPKPERGRRGARRGPGSPRRRHRLRRMRQMDTTRNVDMIGIRGRYSGLLSVSWALPSVSSPLFSVPSALTSRCSSLVLV